MMNLFILAIFILFVIGLFNPKVSLFWYTKERTRLLSAIIYGGLWIISVYALVPRQPDEVYSLNTKTPKFIDTNVSPKDSILAQNQIDDGRQSEERRIKTKLKLKAEEDWPNDYNTQEYWINKQIDDYRYMLIIPDGPVKRQAQQDWPLDFSTQKYWYNQQLAAKQRLND